MQNGVVPTCEVGNANCMTIHKDTYMVGMCPFCIWGWPQLHMGTSPVAKWARAHLPNRIGPTLDDSGAALVAMLRFWDFEKQKLVNMDFIKFRIFGKKGFKSYVFIGVHVDKLVV